MLTLEEARATIGQDLLNAWPSLTPEVRQSIALNFTEMQTDAARILHLVDAPVEKPTLIPDWPQIMERGHETWECGKKVEAQIALRRATARWGYIAYMIVVHLLAAMGLLFLWLIVRALQ